VLANDPDIQISRIQLQEAGYAIRSAQGFYDPVASLQAYHTRSVTPVTSILGGSADGKLTQETWSATPQVNGLSPWGGTYTLNFANQSVRTDSQFSTLNPLYPTTLNLNLTQPLWRGLRFDENRHRLQVARKTQQLSAEQLRQRAIEVVTQAVQAYWELDYAWQNFQVQSEAVKLAERQYESNRRQAEQGILAPIDAVAAQTQVATFQQSFFLAQQTLTVAENNLKSLMLARRGDLMWSTALVPETELDPHASVPALDDAIKQALAGRPELAENTIATGVNTLDARLAREVQKPHIDAFANLSTQGLAGTSNTSLSSSPLAVFFPSGFGAVPQLVGGYGQSLSNLGSGNFATVQVGLQFSLPIRNRTAAAQAATAAAEGRRLKTQQDQLGMAIEADVRNALQTATDAQLRFDAAALARRSAEDQYASEQRQFQAGTSTTFLVLQRQTDLISARAREVRARADCAEAMANVDRATAHTLEARGITVR
jgi:HAE1 family hydrophobic/amphiphilic exporter-1